MKSWIYSGLASVLSLACGQEGAPQPPAKELCPGGEGLSLSITLRGGNLQTVESAFAEANGSLFVHVSRDCEFWVNGQSWFTKHGSLTEEQESELHEKLRFDELAATEGTWGTAGCSDGSTLAIDAAGSRSRCLCSCQNSSTPDSVARLSDVIAEWANELGDHGEDWSGERRLLMVEASWVSSYAPVEWPNGYDVSDFLSSSEASIVGELIPEELDQELRTLQHQYDDGDNFITSRPSNPLPVKADAKVYGAYFQDVLPF